MRYMHDIQFLISALAGVFQISIRSLMSREQIREVFSVQGFRPYTSVHPSDLYRYEY